MANKNFKDRFDKLADALFVEKPAVDQEGPCRYVQSHGFYRNRWSAADLDDVRSARHAEADLGYAVRYQELMGPYERHVLGEIVEAPKNLVMIVGHAGSGKSSTIHHVLTHYARYRHPVQPPARFRDDFHRKLYSLRPSHVVVDLETVCDEIDGKSREESSRMLMEKWAARLPTEIIRALAAVLAPSEAPREVLLAAASRAVNWSSGGAGAPPTFRYMEPGHALFQALDRPFQEAQTSDAQYLLMLRAVARLPREEQVAFWHAVLDVIQCSLPEHDKLIVLYDNADPMDPHLQVALQELLYRISQRVSHKIVAPVRPVAFKIRSFTGGFSWYPHSGPSPLDVISQRLLCFVAHPQTFKQFLSLPTDRERHIALSRAFDVLLRIHRGHGRHRSLGRVMSALAGDSARRMIRLARRVFESNWLSEEYSSEGVGKHLDAIRRRYEYRAIIDRLGEALADEMTALADELGAETGTESQGRHLEHVAHAGDRVIEVVRSVLRNAVQVENHGLAAPDLELFTTLLLEADGGGACTRSTERGWENVLSMAIGKGYRQDAIVGFARAVVSQVRSASTGARSSELECLLLEFVAKALELSIHGEAFVESDVADGLGESVDLYESHEFFRQILRVNKAYAPAQVVLRSKTLAENVFFVAGTPSPLKLRVLYRLAQCPGGTLPVGTMLAELSSAGFKESDVLAGLNSMIGAFTRLLWADRSFEYRSYADLAGEGDKELVLSRSGWGYYFVLLSDIDYLLAMFSRDERQPVSLTRQIELLVDGLWKIATLESANDAHRSSNESAHDWQRRTSTALDVAVRVCAQFCYVVERHMHNLLEGTGDELDALLGAATRFASLIHERREAIRTATGWDYCCDRSTENVIFTRSLDPLSSGWSGRRSARNAGAALATATALVHRLGSA